MLVFFVFSFLFFFFVSCVYWILMIASRLSTLMHAYKINSYFVPTQVPGFKTVKKTTASAFGSAKDIIQRIKGLASVDNRHFPKRSMRFTAVYSRDKEYL